MKATILVILFLHFHYTFASSIDRISYQGRLLQVTGTPIAGPVDLTFKVYLNAVATAECSQTINAVSLSQGIFNVELTFPADCTGGSKTITQFMIDAANNGDSVYIEITDDTHSKTYGKQMFTANTFAMVAKGVTNQSISNTSLLGMSANCANGEIIQTDGLGNFYCGSINGSLGSGIDAVLIGDGSVNNTEYQYLDGVTSNIQTQLNGKQAADADLTDLADGSLTGSKVVPDFGAQDIMTTGQIFGGRRFSVINNALDVYDSDGNETPYSRISADSLHTNGLGDGQIFIEGRAIDANTTISIGGGLAGAQSAQNVIIGDNSEIYVNTGTNRVGIGKAPTTTLDVDGTVTATSFSGSGSVPSGAVMFFDLASCPAGWSELTTARGRYMVARPNGGTLGAAVGTALSNQENRAVGQHNHTAGNQNANHTHTHDHPAVNTNTINLSHTHGVRGSSASSGAVGIVESSADSLAAYNTGASSYYTNMASGNQVMTNSLGGTAFSVNMPNITSSANSASHTHVINNSGSVAGTNAPYIQLLACKKN